MSEPFKIYIDRLKGGHTEKIERSLHPSFLGPEEPELKFPQSVTVKGEAYVSEDHLILRLKAKTVAQMPCAVCNRMIEIELKTDDFTHAQILEEIPGAIFDFSESLREALLIELPRTVECNNGKCPEREVMAAYLRAKAKQDKTTYFPFADMEN